MTVQTAKYFNSIFFTARPELKDINLDFIFKLDHKIPISLASNEEIEMAKPKDVARLFRRLENCALGSN